MTDQQLQSLQNWSEGAKKYADSFGSLGSGVEAAGRAGAAGLKELLKHLGLKTPLGQKLLDKFIDALGGAAGELGGALSGGMKEWRDFLNDLDRGIIDELDKRDRMHSAYDDDPNYDGNPDNDNHNPDDRQREAEWERDLFDNPPISPLVFDLTGNGLNLIDIADSQAFFDLNLDGFAQHTAWIGEGNAFLAYDWNGNGVIDDNSELFGSATVDGFTILAQYDTNGDGVIDAQDEIFDGLLLWQDLNGNGISEEGELLSLADMGITSINLDAIYINQWSGGNWLSHESTFTWANGDTGQIIDVWFENSTLHTRYRPRENLELADDILILPDLAGYGTATDLHVAMHLDEDLKNLVTSVIEGAAGKTVTQMRASFEEVIFAWTGTTDVLPASRGSSVDGRKLAVLEVFHGREYEPWGSATNPGPNAGSQLNQYYGNVLTSMFTKFMVQVPASYLLIEFLKNDEIPEVTCPPEVPSI